MIVISLPSFSGKTRPKETSPLIDPIRYLCTTHDFECLQSGKQPTLLFVSINISQMESKVVLRDDLCFCLSWSLDSARWRDCNPIQWRSIFLSQLLAPLQSQWRWQGPDDSRKPQSPLPVTLWRLPPPCYTGARSDLRKWVWHVGLVADRRWAENCLDPAHVMSRLQVSGALELPQLGLRYARRHCSHEMRQSDCGSRCTTWVIWSTNSPAFSWHLGAHGWPWVHTLK